MQCRSIGSGPLFLLAVLTAWTSRAATIVVPNGSFETPDTTFVTTVMTPWNKTPVAPGYTATEWDQAEGIFENTAAGQPSRINNAHGSQIAYMFANPTLGIYQDLTSADAKFQPGFAYDLTVGVGSGYTYPLADGTVLRLALYFVTSPGGTEGLTEARQVAFTDVVFSAATFPGYDLKDVTVHVPGVAAGDAWAGNFIGVKIVAITDSPPTGATWSIDNVRLTSTAVPEPGVWGVLALGLGTLCVRRRR